MCPYCGRSGSLRRGIHSSHSSTAWVRYLLISAENNYEFEHNEPINPFEELLLDGEALKRLQAAVEKYVGV